MRKTLEVGTRTGIIRLSRRYVAQLGHWELMQVETGNNIHASTRRCARRVGQKRHYGRMIGTNLRLFANAKQRRQYRRMMKPIVQADVQFNY